MKYRASQELTSMIIGDYEELINAIPEEKVAVYLYTNRMYHSTYVPEDGLYQFVFRHFYRLENPSLTQDFKDRFFDLMEGVRGETRPNVYHITKSLYEVANHKGAYTLQFPLATAMLHAINPAFPHYDTQVFKAFDFSSAYHLSGFYKKMKRYIDQYRHMYETYQKLIDLEEMQPVFDHFDERFGGYQLPVEKKIDLIVSQLGSTL
ncbi:MULTISPECIES: hypothetical protein [Salimicrobium]|uniref:Uncharacterized protein n=4 Tax=Salimicrobium TaxID=351195 RepID=A0AAC8PQ87_9BACI|nr:MULTISPECIES: hypothetical protein [Salimicrobium]AKG03743.1 hypothetical protein AAV35_002355 [Salimicrobium jeotgali]MBM7697009.1 hypothetical protein [Salimicrobium jeotgali]